MKADWEGSLYCGIALKWEYDAKTLNISMLGYIAKLLLKFKHGNPCNVQSSPYKVPPNIYCKGAQYPMPDNTLKKKTRAESMSSRKLSEESCAM